MAMFAFLMVFQFIVYMSICGSSAARNGGAAVDELPHVAKMPGKFLIIMFPYPGGSHDQQLATIGSELVKKGHVLHLLTNDLPREKELISSFKASDVIYYKSPFTPEEVLDEEAKLNSEGQDSKGGGVDMILRVMKNGAEDCRSLLSDTAILTRIQDESYDFIITEPFFPCDVLLAHHLNMPFIVTTTTRDLPSFRTSFYGFPAELSYSPETCFGATDKMTFTQRVQNVFQHLLFSYVVPPILLRDFIQLQKDYDINPETSLPNLMGKAALWLSYSDLSLDYPHPRMPNYVPVGGLALKDTKALESELEEFIQGSGDNGIIVFSLGSKIGAIDNTHSTETLSKVFSRLPQRVIWRHDGEQPENLGSNTKIMKWIPQNDLLGHSKTRLFIGHGGLNGVYEALYHEVPMIVIPLIAPDQWDNAARVVSKGMGLQLDSKTITEDNLYEAISQVLNNKRFQAKVSHYSAILRDLPPAKDRAIFWIEHVLKFGDEHLRAHVFELNLIQYYLLDVAAFLTILVVAFVCILRCMFGFCCNLCRKGSSQHSKND